MRVSVKISGILSSFLLCASPISAATSDQVLTQRGWMFNLVDTYGYSFALLDSPDDSEGEDYRKFAGLPATDNVNINRLLTLLARLHDRD